MLGTDMIKLYDAPLTLIRAALAQAVRCHGLDRVEGCAEVFDELADSVIENAARFAREVLSPLNPIGDRTPSRLDGRRVVTPPGFVDAFRRFREDGWTALGAPPEFGGHGLPALVGTAVGEMWGGANLAFAMCPEAAVGAIEALSAHAAPELQNEYLPRIVRGEWTASMAMTEPQAGSDLSTLRTSAVPDGQLWRLKGRKIFISWGEHDLTENIVHLVLARAAGAPEGVKGLSLFLVPKLWPRADGSLEPNDIHAISLEHKMGIRASPTCVMVLGENEGARGWLIGQLNGGLACMFTMMNHMRLGVGMHSLGCAERALQLARTHAHERLQGRNALGAQRPIIEHADVRRMLLTMKALTHAARMLVYYTAACLDVAHRAAEPERRAAALARAELLTPLVKAWSSETAIEVASLGVQIHGGTGYVDDSEISQIYRDARIGAIFEGTNYIQAQDLLGRKVLRDRGVTLNALLDEMQRDIEPMPPDSMRSQLLAGIAGLREAAQQLGRAAPEDDQLIGSVAHHFLQGFGVLFGGWQWSLAAQSGEPWAMDTARFYAAHILPRWLTHEAILRAGSGPVRAPDPAAI